jgi:hypothetical protein
MIFKIQNSKKQGGWQIKTSFKAILKALLGGNNAS